MKKELRDYTSFKLHFDTILEEAIHRCIKEMYAKAQPSVNYDDIYDYYLHCKEKHIKPDPVFRRYYLSPEEYKYIVDKYISAYNLKNQFIDDCDIIIRDLKEGSNKDLYVPGIINDKGKYIYPHGEYTQVPPISKIIGNKDAKRVINFIKERRDYYKFNITESKFRNIIALGDSPTSNANEVIEYWKTQGIDLKIDPRHYTEDDFWNEENGYFIEDE